MFNLINIFLGLSFIFGSVILAIAFYAIARRLLGRWIDEHTHDMASSIVFRISALHGLILALVFAQELFDYNSIRTTVSKEAIAVGDVFFDLGRLDPNSTLKYRQSLASYTHAVVNDEWERLGKGDGLSPAAWRHWEKTYQGILDLETNGTRDQALVSNMLSTIRQISGYRRERENASNYGVNPLFWTVAIVGILLISVPYMTFPPTFLNITMLAIFGGYTGLIMFAIAAVANPYKLPAKLEPVSMQLLLNTEMANFYRGK